MAETEHKLAVHFDGNETPTYRMKRSDTWRPAKLDMSWRIVDEATGETVDEYHPGHPRRRPSIPITLARS